MNPTPDMIAEAARLLAAWQGTGVYYQGQFTADALPYWQRQHPARDLCLTLAPDGCTWVQSGPDFASHAQQMAELVAQLKRLPRGAWAMVRRTFTEPGEPRQVFDLLIHDGRGYVHTGGPAYHGVRDRLPGFDDAMRGVIGVEVY